MTRPLVAAVSGLVAALAAAVFVQARGADLEGIVVPERLADTGLYGPDGTTIDPRNRAFLPQYPLWTDGLSKRRWVYLPPGAAIDATVEHEWAFPVGTRFWKEFGRDGRRIETRMLWKASATRWVGVSYAWNAEQTEAVVAPEEGVRGAAEVASGRYHGIPSRTDCAACHGSGAGAGPLGFNALQLSPDRDPQAIHGGPPQPGMVTLETLVADGRLAGARGDLLADPPRIRAADPATRTILGYLAANCGTCHNGRGEIAALGPVIRYQDLLRDGDAVARSLLRQPTRWQVPGSPDGASVLVEPGSPDLSAIFVRMRSRSPSSQMPPLGTVVRDQAAVDAMAKWIAGEARVHAAAGGPK
jgi:mono/diheme cytochrome c family protein